MKTNTTLMITDLEMSKDLDRAAMLSVNGGGLFRNLFRFGRRTARRTGRMVIRTARDFFRTIF